MRSLLILIDGLGDDPIAMWQGKTPFEYAEHLYMDKLLQQGTLGAASICEEDIIPESCSCILRLLGVSKDDTPKNRAYLELLANGRDISEFEMVLRCNLVAVDDNHRLVGFNGMGLSLEEMSEAAEACNNILKDVEFIHLSEYRNLLILNKEQKILNCCIQPPHESVGENMDTLLKDLREQSLSMRYLLDEAAKRLAGFSRDGLHYMLYPWGPSTRQGLPSFNSLHQEQGALVCKAEIVAGMGHALGMEVVTPPGATGEVDTDVAAKARATVTCLQHNDFVLAHFNGSDEAGHRRNPQEKADFIARIDKEFLGYVLENIQEPLKIIICGDHITSSVTGKHSRGKVPVVAAYTNKKLHKVMNSYKDILNFLMKECD